MKRRAQNFQRKIPKTMAEVKGLPRHRLNNMPHPFTASNSNHAMPDSARMWECKDSIFCGVCGERCPNNDIWVLKLHKPCTQGCCSKGYSDEYPMAIDGLAMHHKCAKMTTRWCPFARNHMDHNLTMHKTSIRYYREKWRSR